MHKFVRLSGFFLILGLMACQSQHQLARLHPQQEKPTPVSKAAEDDVRPEEMLDDCRALKEYEKSLLENNKLSPTDRKRLVDNWLVTLKGARCPEFIRVLRDKYKDDPAAELINLRVRQMKNLSARDILDMVRTNESVSLDAGDVWAQAENIEVEKSKPGRVSVNGIIADSQSSLKIKADFDARNYKWNEIPNAAELSEELKGKTITLTNTGPGGDAPELTTDLSLSIQESAGKTVKDIKRKIEEAKNPAPSTALPKLTLDFTDREHIDECGSGLITHLLQKDHKTPYYNSIGIEGLSVDADDPNSAEKVFGESSSDELGKKTADFVMAPAEQQKKSDQGFWFFSPTDKNVALYIFASDSLVTGSEEKPFIKTAFSVIKFSTEGEFQKIEDTDSTTKTSLVSYKINTKSAVYKKFNVNFDLSSAYWLKVVTNRVAMCLETRNYAASGVSRDSIRTYILFLLFKDRLTDDLTDIGLSGL